MPAPTASEISSTIERMDSLGILREDADSVQRRLELAVQGHAAATVPDRDMGAVSDWAARFVKTCEAALRQELCDASRGALKEKYSGLAEKAMKHDGLTSLTTTVLNVLHVVNPSFAVASVAVLLAVWVAKLGLNYWCSLPA